MSSIGEFGLKLQEALAGFAGGVVYALVMKQTKPLEAVSSVIVGTLTANYLTDYVAVKVGLDGPGMGFITGLIAMALCQGIIAGAKTIRLARTPDA